MSDSSKKTAWERGGHSSKEKYDDYHKAYYQKNKKRISERRKADLWDGRLMNAKARAKEKGLEFNLTRDFLDSIYCTHCPILGHRLSYGGTGKIVNRSATLDRIDNQKGYVIGNIQILSYQANRMKSNATDEELLKFARYILDVL